MSNRSACEPLLGYYYQFDKTILEILRQDDADAYVTIEGIEDIDLDDPAGKSAIQCKYHSAQRFSKSLIRKPISLMLADYAQRTQRIKYQLYAHFREATGVETETDADWLKSVLTCKNKGESVRIYETLGVDHNELNEFAQLFTLTIGPDFDEQHAEILDYLQRLLECGPVEADHLYYNNALRVVFDTATQKDMSARRICRRDFLRRIDNHCFLFNRWYLQLKGKAGYLKYVRDALKHDGVFQTQKHLLVYLPDSMCMTDDSASDLGRVIQEVSHARFRPGQSLYDAKPCTFVLSATAQRMKEVKLYLLSHTVPYNDGYETISFTPGLFDRAPFILRKPTRSGRSCTDFVDKASYHLRLVTETAYLAHVEAITPPDVVIDFASGVTEGGFSIPGVTLHKIANCDANDLINILT